MIISQSVLNNLTAQAKASPRQRMNMDLRNSVDDNSQRMLNAIEPGSQLPIHRHCHSSETVVCLRGRLVEVFYDELERVCTERIELSPRGPIVAFNNSYRTMAYRLCVRIQNCSLGNEGL